MKKLEIINLVIGLLVIVLLGAAGAYLQKLLTQDSSDIVTILTNQNCDLNQQVCRTVMGKKNIAFDLSKPVKYLQKFDMKFTEKNFTGIEKIIVDFSMRDMQMGINRFELNKTTIPGVWQGTGILPVCVSGRKDWVASIYLQMDSANYKVIYHLTVGD